MLSYGVNIAILKLFQKKYLFAGIRKKFVIYFIFFIENIASFYRKLQSKYQIIRKSNFYGEIFIWRREKMENMRTKTISVGRR